MTPPYKYSLFHSNGRLKWPTGIHSYHVTKTQNRRLDGQKDILTGDEPTESTFPCNTGAPIRPKADDIHPGVCFDSNRI